MELIRSNRTENLADALASRVGQEPLDPFEQEVVVVQGRGIESWLTLALAERLGIWSNPSFPFPRSVIEEVLKLTVGPSEEAAAYAPDRLKWIIARLLHESTPDDLLTYLGDPVDAGRVLRLATSISSVFDDYVVYRPDLLTSWSRGEKGDWQACLWRRVTRTLGPNDLSARIELALPTLRAGFPMEGLPFRRLHLFAIETLPPLFLRFFREMSCSIETTLYVLEPSSRYVGDVDPSATGPVSVDGHGFVSNVGRLSRDFQQLVLLSSDEVPRQHAELFHVPEPTGLLGSLQADIVESRSPPSDENRRVIASSDRSISIHQCASAMREAQVLHELVRDALENDSSLQPEDIIVLTPDIETYAPAFRAVFGQDETHRIPLEVHDRLSRDDAPFYDDFLNVLDILDSRFSVFDLVRLMDGESLREDFRFTPDERARLADLLAEAGVRWGIDADHRAELGFPAEPLHTWTAGLGRLFLGFASVPEATAAFQGLLPRGAPSLADAQLVARLSRLCEVLFQHHRESRQPRNVSAWTNFLGRLCRSLCADDDVSSAPVRIIRETLVDIQYLAQQGGYQHAIPLKTFRKELADQLLKATPAVGFMRRGVTLAELVPLRPVPFRVVCLVGMSEECFPRADNRPSFDVRRQRHLPGDRNTRHDDRHSFLQAVLCARDRLIITYGTRSNGFGTESNPSPVVLELCEWINRYFRREDGMRLLETTVHPLYAFDSAYFDGSELPQSSSRRNLRIAQALAEAPVEPAAIELRSVPGEPDPTVSVDELARWLWNPITTFIERVLLARFRSSELYEPTRAINRVSPLDAFKVGNRLLRADLRDDDAGIFLAAAPEFPDGTWGELERRVLAGEVGAVNARMDILRGSSDLRSELLSLKLADLVLEGRIDGLSAEQRVLKQFTRIGGRAELAAWIEHLLVQAATGTPCTTNLVLRGTETRARVVSFSPTAGAQRMLAELLDVYRQCREAPLPLLKGVSRTFAERYDPDDPAKALKAARTQLADQRGWDECLAYLYGATDPFLDKAWRDSFREAALTVYVPLLEHRSES